MAYRRVKGRPGYVYFMLSEDCLRVKIGLSVRPVRRASELGPSGRALHILEIIQTPKPLALERELHKRYASLHCHGEWFAYKGELKRFLDIT